MTPRGYSEDELVERTAISIVTGLGWDYANCMHEFEHGASPLGRETMGEVVLVSRLRAALTNLNPGLPAEAIEQAVTEITRDRSAMSIEEANQKVYKILKDGVRAKVPDPDGGGETIENVRVVDWRNPDQNDFFLASQFWVTGELHKRRADLVGFVNGIPLVFIELKATHKNLRRAFDDNLRDYKDTIPHIFWPNAVVILSNGREAKVGSLVLDWRKRQQSRARVRLAIENTLEGLPENYTPPLYQEKCDLVYQHMFEAYVDQKHSVYGRTA